jgi:hypothetical protein
LKVFGYGQPVEHVKKKAGATMSIRPTILAGAVAAVSFTSQGALGADLVEPGAFFVVSSVHLPTAVTPCKIRGRIANVKVIAKAGGAVSIVWPTPPPEPGTVHAGLGACTSEGKIVVLAQTAARAPTGMQAGKASAVQASAPTGFAKLGFDSSSLCTVTPDPSSSSPAAQLAKTQNPNATLQITSRDGKYAIRAVLQGYAQGAIGPIR